MIRTLLIVLASGVAVGCGSDSTQSAATPAATPPAPAAPEVAPPSVTYSCPMHPEITADSALDCSECGMKLVPPAQDGPVDPGEDESAGSHAGEHHEGDGH